MYSLLREEKMTFLEALQSGRALLLEPTQQMSLHMPLAHGMARALPAEPAPSAFTGLDFSEAQGSRVGGTVPALCCCHNDYHT